jgi:hypothetical protein
MLSPKVRYCVADTSGVFATVTLNVHAATCDWASRPEQLTVLVPIANVPPLAGVQFVITGAAPPVTVG